MLRRVVALSEGVQGEAGTQNLKPLQLLDGLGRLVTPFATAVPINAADIADTQVSPEHPPGFYGTEESRRALNLATRSRASNRSGACPPALPSPATRRAARSI